MRGTVGILIALFVFVVNLVWFSTIIYVAHHFISKWW